jgi:hypothetical protein
MVGHQADALALRIDDGFVMDGPILEVKDEPGGHAIAPSGLDQIAVSQPSAVKCLQGKEAMD